jgi:hypothetical protein
MCIFVYDFPLLGSFLILMTCIAIVFISSSQEHEPTVEVQQLRTGAIISMFTGLRSSAPFQKPLPELSDRRVGG